MKTINQIISEHSFFKGLAKPYLDLLSGCAYNAKYDEGEMIFREGEVSNHFYLIKQGRVALQINTPTRGAIVIQTINVGDILSWSWLIPPYYSYFDARALETTAVLALNVECLREKCKIDPMLDYEILKRFVPIIANRLRATRMQLMDVYGEQYKG